MPNKLYKTRIAALRAAMKKSGVNGFIVPRADEYIGEYTPPSAGRLEFLTGFTGTAGAAIVLADKAVVLTDGRYTIQVVQQVDADIFETANSMKTPIGEWLTHNANGGDIIGYDPFLHTPSQIEKIEETLDGKNIQLKALDHNLVDDIWNDRPAPPLKKAFIFPEGVAGQASAEKRAAIAEKLAGAGIKAAIITLPDSIAWLLNIRGSDLDYTPVVLSYAIIDDAGKVEWFVDAAKITDEVKKHVGNAVKISPPADIKGALAKIAAEAKKKDKSIGLDCKRSPAWFSRQLEIMGAEVKDYKDPCIAPKAIKNSAEQKGIRAAHFRDGLAVVKFLHWLDGNKDKLDEISVEEKLEEFRKEDRSYKSPSFSTIAGFGPNGAIVHYRATKETNRAIKAPGLLLLDSGAQYEDGTTDITRTIPIGEATPEMLKNFTLVLKGHIAVARAKFPAGTLGTQIDALARQALWNEGLDYAHGTGHGVGCYLSVHEEAASISPRGQEPIKAGMLISNEPGFYKEGEYGIRIENLVLAKEFKNNMLEFDTVTVVPIDRRMIVTGMLAPEEKIWLNTYHETVRKALENKLDGDVKLWLQRATAAI